MNVREIALTILDHLPLPEIQLQTNPTLGLVSLPAWFWLEGYDGQPFGGARASGTNDKAGSALNLQRWVSPRAIKETFVPPTEFGYPFMAEE